MSPMKKLYLFNKIVTIFLVSLFLWQLFDASFKYFLRNTFISSKRIDSFTILFPSITICKKHSNGLHTNDTSLSVRQKVSLLHKRLWKKHEVLFFFSHSKMFNTTYPCNTWGATDGGKPCSFPFIETHFDELQKTCIGKYCYTRFV